MKGNEGKKEEKKVLYMHICVCVYMCVYVHVYIHIYLCIFVNMEKGIEKYIILGSLGGVQQRGVAINFF